MESATEYFRPYASTGQMFDRLHQRLGIPDTVKTPIDFGQPVAERLHTQAQRWAGQGKHRTKPANGLARQMYPLRRRPIFKPDTGLRGPVGLSRQRARWHLDLPARGSSERSRQRIKP